MAAILPGINVLNGNTFCLFQQFTASSLDDRNETICVRSCQIRPAITVANNLGLKRNGWNRIIVDKEMFCSNSCIIIIMIWISEPRELGEEVL